MEVSVSRHLMDEHFTVIWANECYYRMIGYTKGVTMRPDSITAAMRISGTMKPVLRIINEKYPEYDQCG